MNLNIVQTIMMALIQGVTELFPISSLGHMVIFPALLGWADMETGTQCGGKSCFLPFTVALHLGTSIALLLFFWRDWLQVIQTLFNSVKRGEVKTGTDEWISWLIIIGCIPAGLLGVFLESKIKDLFSSPVLIAAFLVLNGSVLFLGEALRRRTEASFKMLSPKEREVHFRPLKSLSWKEGLIVGSAQALALIPGFSRSGLTMVAGLSVRLTHEDSARYSFLIGTPVILGAALLEIPLLFHQPGSTLLMILLGMIVTGIAAYLSTKFLMKYFETGRLDPFAIYCWAAGLLSLAFLIFVRHM
jgi:undecaprenyl-diphosphatase